MFFQASDLPSNKLRNTEHVFLGSSELDFWACAASLLAGSNLNNESTLIKNEQFFISVYLSPPLFAQQGISLRFPHWQMCKRTWWSISMFSVVPRWSTGSTTQFGLRPTSIALWVEYAFACYLTPVHVVLDSLTYPLGCCRLRKLHNGLNCCIHKPQDLLYKFILWKHVFWRGMN